MCYQVFENYFHPCHKLWKQKSLFYLQCLSFQFSFLVLRFCWYLNNYPFSWCSKTHKRAQFNFSLLFKRIAVFCKSHCLALAQAWIMRVVLQLANYYGVPVTQKVDETAWLPAYEIRFFRWAQSGQFKITLSKVYWNV